MNNITLSLIIPCYNEEKNIKLIIEKLIDYLGKKDFEFILVNNGSSDNTIKEIKKYSKKYSGIKLIEVQKNIGYGNGIYQGLKKAKGEFIGWTHGDIQTNPLDSIKALNIIKNQKNPEKSYVKGKRYGRQILDVFFTSGMSMFETIYLGKYMYDINAQPNVFHKSFLELIKNPPKDFSFDLYAYYTAKKNKYKVIRFPTFFGKRIYGESAWNDGMKARIKFVKRTIKFTFNLKKKLKNSL